MSKIKLIIGLLLLMCSNIFATNIKVTIVKISNIDAKIIKHVTDNISKIFEITSLSTNNQKNKNGQSTTDLIIKLEKNQILVYDPRLKFHLAYYQLDGTEKNLKNKLVELVKLLTKIDQKRNNIDSEKLLDDYNSLKIYQRQRRAAKIYKKAKSTKFKNNYQYYAIAMYYAYSLDKIYYHEYLESQLLLYTRQFSSIENFELFVEELTKLGASITEINDAKKLELYSIITRLWTYKSLRYSYIYSVAKSKNKTLWYTSKNCDQMLEKHFALQMNIISRMVSFERKNKLRLCANYLSRYGSMNDLFRRNGVYEPMKYNLYLDYVVPLLSDCMITNSGYSNTNAKVLYLIEIMQFHQGYFEWKDYVDDIQLKRLNNLYIQMSQSKNPIIATSGMYYLSSLRLRTLSQVPIITSYDKETLKQFSIRVLTTTLSKNENAKVRNRLKSILFNSSFDTDTTDLTKFLKSEYNLTVRIPTQKAIDYYNNSKEKLSKNKEVSNEN